MAGDLRGLIGLANAGLRQFCSNVGPWLKITASKRVLSVNADTRSLTLNARKRTLSLTAEER